jgi:thermitase
MFLVSIASIDYLTPSEGTSTVFAARYKLPRYLGLLLLTSLILAPVAVVAATVNDALVSQQWGWYRIKADRAYDTGYHGAGVVVALLDTGVDMGHPDLAANIIGGWNFVDNNDNITDVDGHGTMVAGIVAALANNGIGIAGVAPNVSIMPLKVLSGNETRVELNSAIRYAVDNGAKVIGMSFGNYTALPQAAETAVDYAYRRGCVLVAGVGNDNSTEPFYPAAYDQVIAVSAIDQTNHRASFSNYGSYVDFCAPGVSVLTTTKGGIYSNANGTSFAAPFVTGVVALMLSKSPSLSPGEVVANLRIQAEDLGVIGWDQFYGWGLVDAYVAVSDAPIPEFSSVIFFVAVISVTAAILTLKRAHGLGNTRDALYK